MRDKQGIAANEGKSKPLPRLNRLLNFLDHRKVLKLALFGG
jgi:hypothetical protein